MHIFSDIHEAIKEEFEDDLLSNSNRDSKQETRKNDTSKDLSEIIDF